MLFLKERIQGSSEEYVLYFSLFVQSHASTTKTMHSGKKKSEILTIIFLGENFKGMCLFCTVFSRNRKHDNLFYTVKKVNDFPVPSRDVTNKALLGRE
jgi:hypothetical protein